MDVARINLGGDAYPVLPMDVSSGQSSSHDEDRLGPAKSFDGRHARASGSLRATFESAHSVSLDSTTSVGRSRGLASRLDRGLQ